MSSYFRSTLGIAAIVAAALSISSFISTEISNHQQLRAPKSHDIVRHDRRQLMPNGFNDPKTVELRPAVQLQPTVNDYAQTDANAKAHLEAHIMDQFGAPAVTRGIGYMPPQTQPAVEPNAFIDVMFEMENDMRNIQGALIAAGVSNVNNEMIPPSIVTADTNTPPTTNDNNSPMPLPRYNIENAILSVKAFRYTLFFFVYDSTTDTFVIVHNIPGCKFGCHRIYRIASVLSFALRKNFPKRFEGVESGDLVFMMSCGDAPRINVRCLSPSQNYCDSVDFAPILQFGSIFSDAHYLPSMIAMPLPVRPHLPCFHEWQSSEEVCQDLQPKVDFSTNTIKTGIVFGQELGILDDIEGYWDNLIPQIIWRGTDFGFLHTMFHGLRTPEYRLDIAPKEGDAPRDEVEKKRWAIKTLWEMGDDKLLPRWRGVLLTSEAELEASLAGDSTGNNNLILPWVNIKFVSINLGGEKVSAAENEEYQILQNLGISCVGERVNMMEQAKYKYHIDLGGGGGTTWTGTIEKLALPGVLFHHVTPTKDWFHDLLVPWEHYIPIMTDLSDLRENFEWAESHPAEAKQIAEAGTRFARWMGSVEGFGQLYEAHLVSPLRNVLRAYTPLPPEYAGKSVLDVINEASDQFSVIARCSGLHSNSCKILA